MEYYWRVGKEDGAMIGSEDRRREWRLSWGIGGDGGIEKVNGGEIEREKS